MNTKPNMLIVLTGFAFLLFGATYLLGVNTLPSAGGLTCKSICGLGLLFSSFFGQHVGGIVVGSIWAGLGGVLCLLAFRVSR